MVKKLVISKYFACSIILNLSFIINIYLGGQWKLSWSSRAAVEAETVVATYCSGHGRAFLDGLIVDGNTPACECNTCFTGSDCSQFIPHCPAIAQGGNPLFLEPFWMQHLASSALVVPGWHRMSYSYNDNMFISRQLEKLVRRVHASVGNAVTENRFIVLGSGAIHVLNAAVFALSPENTSSSPARVVASVPGYPKYKKQTQYFSTEKFKFDGDAYAWRNRSDAVNTNMIEFVTSPNNPDGQLKEKILYGPNVKAIYDHTYYWPHFTPIPAPSDEDVMVFTLSKLTGHAGTRLGWAVVKDETVFNRMIYHMQLNSMGISKDAQLRAFKLIKAVLEGTEIFDFGYQTMKSRWDRLARTISLSNRFSLQENIPRYCTFYSKIRQLSPAYAWLKCEREEDKDCYAVLKEAKIMGRQGSLFGAEDRYVRLSLVGTKDDFDILIKHLSKLISEEDDAKTM